MKSRGKRALVPKLRFPEFQDEGEWEVKPLKSICFMQAGKFVSASDIFEHGNGGIYPCYGGNGLRGYTKSHTHSGKYPLIGRQGALCGNVNLVNGQFHATEHAVVVSPKEGINVDWLFYTLDLLNLNRFATGQAQPGLSVEALDKLPSVVPQEPEQQKIADCLSSIDELVTLEAQKLDSLKAHKKGLMQQLFPAEGETLPKLRFPEFREAGEWENKKFGEICKFVRGPFGGALKKDIFVKDGYAIYEQSHAIYQNFDSFRYFITEQKFNELKRFSVRPNDIIMSCSGTMGKFAVIPTDSKKGVINQALLKLTVNKRFVLDFVKYTLELPLNQEKLLSQSAGGAIKNVVGVGELKEIEIYMPGIPEQQKIADCLSSIDELITAQSQKLDMLKTHKKGLMQQLFPVLDEVQG